MLPISTKKKLNLIFTPPLTRLSTFKLKKQITFNHIEDYVDLAFNFQLNLQIASFHMIPKQIKEEITQLLKLLSKNPPKTICEIGTAEGGTLFLFSKVSNPDATIISIDLPESRSTKWRIPFYKSFATHNQKIHIIHSNSHSLYTVEKVQQILNNRKLDFLFIDGDHSYEGVKEDFEMYSKLVDKNGLIAFHDICLHPPQTGCKVNQFWNEIKQRYKHLEIIKNPKQNWAGIGIVQTNKNLF